MKVKAKLSRDLRGRYGVECLYRILKIHIYNAYIFMHIYIYICTYIHSCKCEKHKIISNLANKLCAPNETKQNEVRRDNCPACFLPAWWLPAGYARTITELVAGRVGRGQSKKNKCFSCRVKVEKYLAYFQYYFHCQLPQSWLRATCLLQYPKQSASTLRGVLAQ